MTVYKTVEQKITKTIETVFSGLSLDLSKLVIEPTKNPQHGDIATNVAMILSKQIKKAPSEIAQIFIEALKVDDYFSNITCAGPGFINLTLKNNAWHEELLYVLGNNGQYDFLNIGKNKNVNVEFVSANPTGPLHTGHGRNAILGDTIASLLEKIGYNVTREYYINDAGGQIRTLVQSVYLRYKEACGLSVSPEEYEGKYPGEYLIPLGEKLFQEYGKSLLEQSESDYFETIRSNAVSLMMESIKQDLQNVGIIMDSYVSEKELSEQGFIEKVLEKLSNDIYIGVLTPPKGHTVDDWEERPQTLFQSTKYGDDIDRALKKSDNSWTYFAGDLGYHLHKIERQYDKMINLFGADHVGYIKRLKAAVKALSNNKADFEIKASQLVNFLENGQPVKMSKRAGTFITLKDVVDRVGKDATRFMMISRHQDIQIDFDFQKAIEASKDNPIFYIQYAHARIHSVMNRAQEMHITKDKRQYKTLIQEKELHVLKTIAQWPREIELAAKSLEPHRICNYLYSLASDFHSLWNEGKTNVQMRFIDENNIEITQARLNLLQALAIVIHSGLELLGIEALKEM